MKIQHFLALVVLSLPTVPGARAFPPAPTAVTQPADQFMPGSARLNGLVSPYGLSTLAWFEWGTSLAYGNVTPPQSVGSGNNVVGFSNVLVGLDSNTVYHFRARASNAFGFGAGLDQTFNLLPPPPTNCVAVSSGLVAWWRAEGNANDATGAHDGQLLYGASFAQGRTGQAFSFGGVRSRVNIPDSDAFKLTNSLTFEGWIRAASWAPGIIFIRGDNRGGLDPYHMSLSSSGHLHWGIDAEDNSFAAVDDPNTLPIGVWTHVAGVFNGANGDLDLYVNGSLVSHTTTQLRPFRELDPNFEPAVGIGNSGGTFHEFPYHGLIDEWALYGRALSGQEILGIYQAGALGKCTINPRPGVTTLAADPLSPTSARLRGQVNPHGSLTAAWFEWGTDTTYGNSMGMQDVGQGSSVSNVNVVLGGLVIGTEYHFRALASNAFGFTAGLDQTFNLITQRPVVTTLAPDQLTNTSARLRGQVNPRGWPTTAWFEWGTDTNYGNVIGMQDVGQGSSVSNLNVVLNGLMVGPNYHYRLVATNAFGAVYGTNQTFNTAPKTLTWTGADPSGYWSAPANWSPASGPVNGPELVFPGGLPPEDMVSTNDLTDSTFRSIKFVQAGGHTIRGNPITLTSPTITIINSGTNVIACDLTLSGFIGGSVPFNSGELTVIGNVGGGSLRVGVGAGWVVIRGQFTGGSVFVDWYSTLALYGDNPHPVSADVAASTLLVQGSQPNLNIRLGFSIKTLTAGSLSGDGVVGDVTGYGGITPDSTLSVKNVSVGSLFINLNGPNVGEYGKLVASGGVSLGSGSLRPSAGFNPQAGQVYTIVEKTSPGAITNAFLGPEGTVTILNGMRFRISYVGGDGNDVTLTATDNPPTVTITNPPNDAVFEPPASFTLGAAAGGSVTNVQFFLDATSLGNDTSSPYSVPVSGLAVGNYTLTAVASDDAGRHATNSIAITVQPRADWDVSQDFSLTANPGGPWSYGYMNVLGGAFSLLTHSQYAPDNNGLMIFLWSKNGYEPVAVFKNQTSQTSISDGGYGTFPPGTVWFSGGIEGHVDNYGVIRFTVPADNAGTYRVETVVRTYLDGPASRDADFWVLKNGIEVFSHFLGPNSRTGYTNIFTLAAGDTIDFVCGRGQDNTIHGSGLKIRATLTVVSPVPIVLGAVQRPFDTQSVFSYSADVGLRYAVERSATLSNWTTIRTDTANTNPMTVTDTAATNWMNFYRVRLLPNP